LKPIPSDQKLRGGYYTPKIIADFLAKWAIKSKISEVLEPSCGDGILIESAIVTLKNLGAENNKIAKQIQGIEIDSYEMQKTSRRFIDLGIPLLPSQLYIGDFFTYCKTHLLNTRNFDAIIGNPPFIRYQNFLEENRKIAFELMKEAGLRPNRLTNSWVPFLITSALLLKENGRLAMVIPAELFQVNYAAETRKFLSEYLTRITLITFKRLVFDNVQEEIILLLGEKTEDNNNIIRTIELNGLEDLASYKDNDFTKNQIKPMDHSTEKWTQYFLDQREIELLRTLRSHPNVNIIGNMMQVDVGVVTGENKFFVLTDEQIKDYSLCKYTRRIVSRSGHLQGIIFSESDWATNVSMQYPAYLLLPPDFSVEHMPDDLLKYIEIGEQLGINRGYKCSIRKKWYMVPSTWIPETFMLRQVHSYPKLVCNEAYATCTDTVHRAKCLNSANAKVVASSFLNSLTFAFAEITGRSYGGGVLTFEPNESEKLPLPVVRTNVLDVIEIDMLVRANKIETVLDITDKALLIEGLGLSVNDTKLLRGIWNKMRDRRLNRRQ